ncbi:MAG: TatD family hydrolase, partial [Anaerolineae bacterium]
MRLADTHAHVSDSRFDGDREAVLERAREAGVALIVDAGADPAGNERAVAFAHGTAGVVATVGIHPHYVAEASEDDWRRLAELVVLPGVVAVGETGLDFYRDLSPRQQQREGFERHLALAAAAGKPVIVHSRDAGDEVLEQLARWQGRVRAVLHCFSGDAQTMRRAVDIGCCISIAGNVTYPSAAGIREAARQAPAASLMIETDCPYLAPVPMRGKRNEPRNVAA